MIELLTRDYKRAEKFFSHKKQHIPALSVIHGVYPGRVFVNRFNKPTMAVVWAVGRWMYLEGGAADEKDAEGLNRFIQETVIPACKQRQESWFEIYASDAGHWDELLLKPATGYIASKHDESVYTLKQNFFDQLKDRQPAVLPEGIEVRMREYPVLAESARGLSYVQDEFYTKTCLGAEVRRGNEVVSVCRNNGFMHDGQFFVDIDTFSEEHRGKGYATLAAIRLIDAMLDQGLTPLWETTHQNTASHNLALKLGFEVKESYPVYAFEIGPVWG